MDILALIEGEALQSPLWNDSHKSWNFSGKGFSYDIFTIACAHNDGTLILTVFWE